ncbi:MAG: hypothetical protein ACI8Q9_001535 [Planctomycetota bacterium]|jgi:hypothetical protein
MLSATTTLPALDLPHAAGHVRAVLERAGVRDIFLTKTATGFRARGIRGGTGLAVLGGSTPLGLLGWFSRNGVEVLCKPSLNEGNETLHVTLRVRCLRELDDHDEDNWITRGPAEMLGDALQSRRVLRKIMRSIVKPAEAAPEGFGADPGLTTKQRRERFQERYKRGKRRRALQMAAGVIGVGIYFAVRTWLDGRI